MVGAPTHGVDDRFSPPHLRDHAEATVKEIADSIKDEDRSIKSVELLRDGEALPPGMAMEALLKAPFTLVVNGQPFLIQPPPYVGKTETPAPDLLLPDSLTPCHRLTGGAYVSLDSDTEPDVRLLAQKSAIIRVRKLLEVDPRSKMRYKVEGLTFPPTTERIFRIHSNQWKC